MNFLFLSIFISVAYAANTTAIKEPMLIQQFRNHPNAFIAQMQKADPGTLRQIIELLNGLLVTSEDTESDLWNTLETKTGALATANDDVLNAEGVLTASQTAKDAADLAVTDATNDLSDKQGVQSEKVTKRNDAKAEYDSEIDSLNDEQTVLLQVIGILGELLGKQEPVKLFETGVLEDQTVFDADWGVGSLICRKCPSCVADYKTICYKRLSEPCGAATSAFTLFTTNWYDDCNALNVDFELFSSVDDAVSGSNRWNWCNYNDPGIGFPRDCGKTGFVGGQWNSRHRGGHAVTYWSG